MYSFERSTFLASCIGDPFVPCSTPSEVSKLLTSSILHRADYHGVPTPSPPLSLGPLSSALRVPRNGKPVLTEARNKSLPLDRDPFNKRAAGRIERMPLELDLTRALSQLLYLSL